MIANVQHGEGHYHFKPHKAYKPYYHYGQNRQEMQAASEDFNYTSEGVLRHADGGFFSSRTGRKIQNTASIITCQTASTAGKVPGLPKTCLTRQRRVKGMPPSVPVMTAVRHVTIKAQKYPVGQIAIVSYGKPAADRRSNGHCAAVATCFGFSGSGPRFKRFGVLIVNCRGQTAEVAQTFYFFKQSPCIAIDPPGLEYIIRPNLLFLPD